jgi:hypothetical protein
MTAKVRPWPTASCRRGGAGLAPLLRGRLAATAVASSPDPAARARSRGRGAVRRAHPAAAHGRQSALFEAAKEKMS